MLLKTNCPAAFVAGQKCIYVNLQLSSADDMVWCGSCADTIYGAETVDKRTLCVVYYDWFILGRDSTDSKGGERPVEKGKKAIEVLKSYWNTYDPLRSLPIDVVDIARKLGFFVFQASFDGPYNENLSGYIRAEEDMREICVNKNDVPTRQRFTVAHELGHYHLHRIGNEITHISKRSEISLSQETEADKFAEELIMPEELLRKEHGKLLIPTTKELAKIFAVSPSAMRTRLRKLGLGVFNDFT